MEINSVNSNPATQNGSKKKSNAINNGLKIGGWSGLIATGVLDILQADFFENGATKAVKNICKNKVGALLVGNVIISTITIPAICAGIGAGIGAIVKACKKEKE